MNFFEQQDIAQRKTTQLLVLLGVAIVSLIAITTLFVAIYIYYTDNYTQHADFTNTPARDMLHAISGRTFFAICSGIIAVVGLGSLYKFIQLAGGGKRVAEAMGGIRLNPQNANADEKKILNVVEEMAIASGTPVPPVYLIEDEAMNAFAAGHSPQDAVIGVTRGLIRILNRDELQGVIAHEFSHIFHGDMKLNMRLVALLNGILLIGLIGEFVVRTAGYRQRGSDKDKSPAAFFALGLGLMIIGYAGTFFGNLIKSAVSRQREFLADASAVKFTRNPSGISGALKKLGGYVGGSQLDIPSAAQFSHLFFSDGTGSISFFNALATHPPLAERIKRIDPQWDGEFPSIDVFIDSFDAHNTQPYLHESQHADNSPIEFVQSLGAVVQSAEQMVQSIGNVTQAHLAYAQKTLSELSDAARMAAQDPWDAQALILGLLLDKKSDIADLQRKQLAELYSAQQIEQLTQWINYASLCAEHLRLPLLELCIPALKCLSQPQYKHFKRAMNMMINADQQISLLEWSLFRILTRNLEPLAASPQSIDATQLENEICILLSLVANADTQAQVAFDAGKTVMGIEHRQLLAATEYTIIDADRALTRLSQVKPLQKPKLLKAIHQCITVNQNIGITQIELFRAIADSLDCPIPPLLKTSPAN